MPLNTTALEKKLARKSAVSLRGGLRSAIANSTNSITGLAAKTNVRTRFRSGRLDRLIIVTPHYIIKQHYGFEGIKKSGVNMRLKATNALNIAIKKTKALEKLADGITDIRAEQVEANITFF